MTDQQNAPEQRTIPSYAKIAEQTFGTLWQEAKPADWALVVYNLREKLNAMPSETPRTYEQGLEDAAKVCKTMAARVYDHAKGPFLECAEAIRALKQHSER